MKFIALSAYKNENEHFRVWTEIANYKDFEKELIPTEEGDKEILVYIQNMRLPGKWSENIEFIISNIIYNFN